MNKTFFRFISCLIVAVCFTATAAAIEKDSDGYYLIGTTADYEVFCDLVNRGDPFAWARVTADGISVTRGIGVGDSNFHYRGIFDGQGHTLTIAYTEGGLFANTEAGCIIRNVNIAGTVCNTAALVGVAVATTIENCSSNASIDDRFTPMAAGLVKVSRGPITMKNCSFTGEIISPHAAGLIGRIEHTAYISGCRVTGPYLFVGNLNDGANFVDDSWLNDEQVTTTVAPPSGSGITFEGIRYDVNEQDGATTLTLAACNSEIKAVKIPQTINYNGKDCPVTTIGVRSMSYNKLEYLLVPSSVTRIENNAFHESSSLKEVVFADAETKLWLGDDNDFMPDEELFYACPVEKVYVGRNLAWDGTVWHDEPFEAHDNLAEITFGPRVTIVGNVDDPTCYNPELFNGCENVQRYSFLGDEKSLGTEIKFHCCEGMSHASDAYINRDLEASKYTEYTLNSSGNGISDRTTTVTYGPFATYVTPKMYSGYGATPNSYLKTVDFENATRLTTIGERAFADCDYVKEVNLFNTSLTTIEKEGFYDCDELRKVTFSTVIEKIGESAFDDCAITELTLPGTIDTLGYKAFYDCDELTTLTLNPGTGDIVCEDSDGECRTFDSCKSLKQLYMGRDITYKEGKSTASPFYDSYFEQVVIDNAVTKLGEYMFQHSNKLKSMSIGSGITQIPDNCFNETVEVTQFNLVDGDTPITLGNSCRGFKTETMYVGRPINDANNIPAGEHAIKHVQYGETVGAVTSGSFADFPNLENVILPRDITVEQHAFVNCGIKELYVQGDATFHTEAFKNCDNINAVTVVGKLTADENAFAPSGNTNAIQNINVFFEEDPKDESHAKAFPQKYLDETTLNNLFDSPYQKVDFSCMPWSGFKHRYWLSANDYKPSTELVENGNYDHAYIAQSHKDDHYFSILMPFDVSTYYFGSDVTAYDLRDGFQKTETDQTLTLTTESPTCLDTLNYFPTNIPLIIKSPREDEIVMGTFDQFQTKQVNVNFSPEEHSGSCVAPYFVSGRDEVINPAMGNLFVIDNGCLKKVNGDYHLPAFAVAFNPEEGQQLHFVDSKTGEPLMPESTDVTPPSHLMGYTTFYSNESSFIADGAEVYTASINIQYGLAMVELHRVKDNVVSQGQGVVIKYIPDKTLTMAMVTHPSSDTETYENNVLKGLDADISLNKLGNVFILGVKDGMLGFMPVSTTTRAGEEAILPAHHAYIDPVELDLDPEELPDMLEIDITTAVNGLNADGSDSPLYDLQGRRVLTPERNTIYIKDSHKIINK